MPGGLIQLVSYGAANIFINGNPQITFFKMVYRRHTHFAMEHIPISFHDHPSLNTQSSTKMQLTIKRHGDLVHDMYLVFDTPDVLNSEELDFKWIPYLGQNLCISAELTIGGQRIDILYGQWMNVWNELVLPTDKKRSYYKMIGNVPEMHPNYFATTGTHMSIPARRLYIPLDFWFCRNSGLALPLIALQYTEVQVSVEFRPLNHLFTIGCPPLAPDYFFSDANCTGSNAALKTKLENSNISAQNLFWKYTKEWTQNVFLDINYIFLDNVERRTFAQSTHEYLITVNQPLFFHGLNQDNHAIDLKLQHPVKEMIWVFQRESVRFSNQWNNYTGLNQIDDYTKLLTQSEIKYNELDFNNDDFLEDPALRQFVSDVKDLAATDCDNLQADKKFQEYHNILREASISMNGHERFSPKDHYYFSLLQHYKYHTGHATMNGIYVYSFAIKPEEDQPSGACNMSRVNKIKLNVSLMPIRDPLETSETYDLSVYSMSNNILRIMGGIGALVFAN